MVRDLAAGDARRSAGLDRRPAGQSSLVPIDGDPDLQAGLRQLRRQVERVERTVLTGLRWLTGALLVGGLLLRYLSVDEAGPDPDPYDLPSASLLTLGFHAVSDQRRDGSADSGNVLLGVCLLLLLVAVLAALWTLVVIGSGTATDTTARAVSVVAALLVVGTAGLLLLAAVYLGDGDGARPGPGVLVLAAGVACYATLAWSELRTWWDPARKVSWTATR